jgi:N-ethylmaleimide reductase
MALDAVSTGAADMVAFGRAFISNPDLVNRLRLDAPLAALKSDTLYGGNAVGYTDYPPLDDALAGGNRSDGNPRAVVAA